jgi:hypothetical protein
VNKTNKALWAVAGLFFAGLVGVAVYRVQPLLNPEVSMLAPLDPECDLRAGPCSADFSDGGRVIFGIQPSAIPLLKPLQLEVQLKGVEAQGVEVDLQGMDMNMGFNRPKLTQVGEGIFRGEGMLPVCVRDAMEWEAKVLVRTEQGLRAAPFRFITIKEGDLPAGQ